MPMLSLENGFSDQDLRDFSERLHRFLNEPVASGYSAEPKMDGLAVELVYQPRSAGHRLHQGRRRLSAKTSVPNSKPSGSIPLRLIRDTPDLLEVRGEVYMEKQGFAELNEGHQLSKGLPALRQSLATRLPVHCASSPPP